MQIGGISETYETLSQSKSEDPTRIPRRVLLEYPKYFYFTLTIFDNSVEKGPFNLTGKNRN